jgi:stearoyl-CoA desaturase (Delta-9 desaturase)
LPTATATTPTLLQRLAQLLRETLDTDYQRPLKEGESPPQGFDWKRTVPYVILHLGCLLVLWSGWSWCAVGVATVLYFLRMFAITAFYHRYFSHRSYRTSRIMQFLFAVLGNSSMQRGPLWWAATHRHHHSHSDEETDKHSPRQHGFMGSHLGWLWHSENFPTDYSLIPDLAKFPELVFLNKRDYVVPLLMGIGLWSLGSYLQTHAPELGTSGFQLFVWGWFISTTILLHGTLFINSLAHVFGSRRFQTGDDSRNSFLLSLITLGEGWHNNHHRYAHSARQGFYWWEIDISYYLLRAMSCLGLVWDLRQVPQQVYDEVSQGKQGQQ